MSESTHPFPGYDIRHEGSGHTPLRISHDGHFQSFWLARGRTCIQEVGPFDSAEDGQIDFITAIRDFPESVLAFVSEEDAQIFIQAQIDGTTLPPLLRHSPAGFMLMKREDLPVDWTPAKGWTR